MNEILKDAYEQYRSQGFILQKSAKHEKHAHRKGSYTERENEPWDDNATGYVAIIPPSLIIVDNDKYQDEGESFKQLLKDLGISKSDKPEPFALTPSGGEHYAFHNPNPELVVGNLNKKYPALDIYAGYQSVVPIVGTTVLNKQDKLASYEWGTFDDNLIVNPWMDVMSEVLELRPRAEKRQQEYDDLDIAIKADDMSEQEVIDLIARMPEDLDYDTWLHVGMAIYDRFGGSDKGYEYFKDFSEKSSNKYDEDFTYGKWHNGHLVPDSITYKRLRTVARDSFIYDIESRIAESEEFDDILEEIKANPSIGAKGVKDADMRLKLAQDINARMKELKQPVTQARTLAKAMTPTVEETLTEGVEGADWMDGLVYVESFSTKYFLTATREKLSPDGANGRLHQELSDLKKKLGMKTLTVQNLVKMNMVRICSNHEYNPKTNEVIFTSRTGATILNTYVADSRPPVAEEYSEKGQALIAKFEQHLKYLMTEGEAEILLDWLAYQAQNFGTKLLWTPLIQSAEGLGKSLLGTAMINNVFGYSNAGTVDSNVVVSPNTSWATKGVFQVLEEIKLAGHNRFEVLNQLKPFITNKTVSRVEKYEASSEVTNYCNFIALTNFKDAIPVSADDRRWWVVFAKVNTIEDLEKLADCERREYFEPLHNLANGECGGEFHKWMMERDLSEFNPNFPPVSIHKARMIATEESKTANLTDLRDVIDHGSRGVTKSVLSSKELRKLTQTPTWEHDSLDYNEVVKLLRALGYTKFPRKVKSKDELHSIWFNEPRLSDDEVRERFHASMKLPANDGFDDFPEED